MPRVPVKVEVFHEDSEEAHTTHHYDHFRAVVPKQVGFYSRCVEVLQEAFEVFVDFPTPEKLVEIFITKNLPSYTKLYLNDKGHILTRIKITKLEDVV